LTIESVSKSFGDLSVLKNLSFEVSEGSIFGFIGKNGSGKTTTMKIIVGLLKADQGTVHVQGKRVDFGETATNRLIGFLPDVPEFYGFMNAMEYLTFCGRITGMNPADILRKASELVVLVGLKGSEKRRLKGYSRGMKQRLGIAQALIHDPILLICDEPTSALDPVGRAELLNILSMVRERTTILFSTHILADVERICDYVGVLDNGSIALEGNLDTIKSAHRKDVIVAELGGLTQDVALQIANRLRELPFVRSVQWQERLIHIGVNSVETDGRLLLAELAGNPCTVLRYQVQEPTLENLYRAVLEPSKEVVA
jgi:ABC-2 type transport system ATP-binding protein